MADYRCKCNGCKHIDPNSRSGYKWWCTYYRSYEDPDIVRECRHFENSNGSGGCFLTSACCAYMGLADDCKELTTLRNFRDTYLKKTDEGTALVEEYYKIAPAIVEKINVHSKKDEILKGIYAKVSQIVSLIETQMYDQAMIAYRDMVFDVQSAVS